MKISKVSSFLSGFLFLIALLLTIIDFTAFLKPLYAYEYRRDDQADKIGMSDEDLILSTNALLDYIRDERSDIVQIVTVNGYKREVFNERETLHMKDVKALYQHAIQARNLILIVAVGLALMTYFIDRKHFVVHIKNGFLSGLLCILITIAFIAVWAIADFDRFWIQFHYLFFDNDLFFLDPNTSIMINMFPSAFFRDMVFAIILLFALSLGFLFLVLQRVDRKQVQA